MRGLSKVIVTVLIGSIVLFGCNTVEKTRPKNSVEVMAEGEKISAKEAKEIMDTEENIVILDVRTEEEYNEGHIKDSILIPLDALEKESEKILQDRNQKILIYCRSGNRSNQALNLLNKLGYKNIYDFGGIIDWEYEIVTTHP